MSILKGLELKSSIVKCFVNIFNPVILGKDIFEQGKRALISTINHSGNLAIIIIMAIILLILRITFPLLGITTIIPPFIVIPCKKVKCEFLSIL